MSNPTTLTRSERKTRKKLLDAAGAALGNANTRYLLRWVLDRAGLFEPSFTGNSGTFYNEGKRDLGLELVNLLNEIDPYEFVRLMKEGADEIVELRNSKDQGEGRED